MIKQKNTLRHNNDIIDNISWFFWGEVFNIYFVQICSIKTFIHIFIWFLQTILIFPKFTKFILVPTNLLRIECKMPVNFTIFFSGGAHFLLLSTAASKKNYLPSSNFFFFTVRSHFQWSWINRRIDHQWFQMLAIQYVLLG